LESNTAMAGMSLLTFNLKSKYIFTHMGNSNVIVHGQSNILLIMTDWYTQMGVEQNKTFPIPEYAKDAGS